MYQRSSVTDVVAIGSNAHLVLIKPREFARHYTRPTSYNFNLSTIETIVDEVSDGASYLDSAALARSPAMMGSILPSADGFSVNTHEFSNYWTFMLVITEPKTDVIGNMTAGKTVSVGVCSEEPISPLGVASATPEQFLNPNCELIITKVLGYKTIPSMGNSGNADRVVNVVDSGIVYDLPGMFDTQDGDALFNLAAENTSNAVEVLLDTSDSYSSSTVIPNMEDTLQSKHKDYTDSVQEVPLDHMKTILSHIQGAVQTESLNRQSNTTWEVEDDYEGGPSAFEENLTADFQEGGYAFSNILRTTTPIAAEVNLTIGKIKNKFNLKTAVMPDQDTAIRGDVIEQQEGSVQNIVQALITNSLPSIVNEFGMVTISFDYESVQGRRRVNGATTLHNELSQEQCRSRADAIITSTERKVFQSVYELGGHFEVSVSCSLTGFTTCRLNFTDYNDPPVDAVYREETMLGGMISPLIGSTSHITNNAVQLSNLTRNITEVLSSKMKIF